MSYSADYEIPIIDTATRFLSLAAESRLPIHNGAPWARYLVDNPYPGGYSYWGEAPVDLYIFSSRPSWVPTELRFAPWESLGYDIDEDPVTIPTPDADHWYIASRSVGHYLFIDYEEELTALYDELYPPVAIVPKSLPSGYTARNLRDLNYPLANPYGEPYSDAYSGGSLIAGKASVERYGSGLYTNEHGSYSFDAHMIRDQPGVHPYFWMPRTLNMPDDSFAITASITPYDPYHNPYDPLTIVLCANASDQSWHGWAGGGCVWATCLMSVYEWTTSNKGFDVEIELGANPPGDLYAWPPAIPLGTIATILWEDWQEITTAFRYAWVPGDVPACSPPLGELHAPVWRVTYTPRPPGPGGGLGGWIPMDTVRKVTTQWWAPCRWDIPLPFSVSYRQRLYQGGVITGILPSYPS